MNPDEMEITRLSDLSYVQYNIYKELKEIPVETYTPTPISLPSGYSAFPPLLYLHTSFFSHLLY